jgi:hypothetical protein
VAISEADNKLFEAGRGILSNRKTAAGTFVFCLYASVTSWRAATHTSHVLHHDSHYFGHHFSHDPIYILGSVVSIFILGDIAFESPLRADCFVFGAGAFSFALSAITQLVSFSSPYLWAIRSADALLWAIAAAICAAVLAAWNESPA